MDPDDELQAWQIANAEADGRIADEANLHHRCPPDMPPCPNCQALIEREDFIEFGL